MKNNYAIKAIISLSLAIVLLCSLAIPVFAAKKEEATAQPRWIGIAIMNVTLNFVGDEGCATATARKNSTASRIEGTLRVYKKVGSSWIEIESASGSKTVGTLALVVDFACEKGVEYKAVWEVCAYTNGTGEWNTEEFRKTCQ